MNRLFNFLGCLHYLAFREPPTTPYAMVF
ncbi:hypothetical protein MTR67_008541 [Solanum verrucosum]|uniref:Uncharacterized protein n=1 Tax=Solanum verrucosum TaxID=315347 RepID=A0AAF0TDQ0_SOLVR|nr:hypothetical protein MTR67_008541 [Solanum verrucosum]